MSDPNVMQLYSVDYVQMLQQACREKDSEIARLTATLPCGHNLVLNDDSYGGCIDCTRQSVYDEDQAEIATLEASTRMLVEAIDRCESNERDALLVKADLTERERLWLEHGHTSMYGDDGEMQCTECIPFGVVDYKRAPMEQVRAAAYHARIAIRKREDAERDALQERLTRSCEDWAEDDTAVRNAIRPILGADIVDGNTHGVPTIVDLVDALVARVLELEQHIVLIENGLANAH